MADTDTDPGLDFEENGRNIPYIPEHLLPTVVVINSN